ncbi:DNA-binding protein HU [Leyella stercorea DSM 18206]|jgi:nucleoid DNA-binding protein|uniref:DNA-binding protein HU n=1 Tax=Leyella stercorea DSM 18206 TaxID=1002367 RepID=G6AZ87_9BACT|nr:HU family DNA-binding protein [Leyella stercorea]EHJ38642.1 DNA-binding protein HU [Leyella stercorea DSM 18206]
MAKVNDFARELSEKYGLSLSDASDFIGAMFDVVNEELDDTDSSVKIKGFGTFKVSAVSARASVDVNTGERIIIDGRNKISFTPEVLLRDRVNRPFVQFETVVLNDGVDFSEIDDEMNELSDSVIETETQGEQLSPTAPTDQPTDQSANQPISTEQPQGVQLSSTAPTDQLTDQSANQPTPTEQPQGVQLSPTAPTDQPTDQPSPSEPASKVVNTEEHRDMARRLMAPKSEPIDDDNNKADEEKSANDIDESDDEGIVIGGCKQRSPRMMYILTIASFVILVSIGIGMYFLYQRIEEKNHVIDRLETRLYAQQDTVVAVEPQCVVSDTIASNDALKAADAHTAENIKKEKKDSVRASNSKAATGSTAVMSAAPTATTPSDYNYDVRVRTGAYIIVGVAKVVTVKSGQSLASISKAYLGEGMECYVEVLNNCHTVKAGDKLKIPEVKLKPRKR